MTYSPRWTGRILCFAWPLFLLLVSLQSVSAQSYSIGWYTFDSGGGTSTGGTYTVTGTVGQPDAGVMSGGNFTLTGGYWSIVGVVQAGGAPLLSIFRSTTNTVVVCWALAQEGWMLQYTTSLNGNPLVWTDISPPYQTNGASFYHVEAVPAGIKFYRLRKP